MSEQIVVHRAFEGEHEDSETCWCRPVVTDSDDLRDKDEIVEELNECDG